MRGFFIKYNDYAVLGAALALGAAFTFAATATGASADIALIAAFKRLL